MSAPYQLIQIKRTIDNKTLNSNDIKIQVPEYGELVFSHSEQSGDYIDELVIGDGVRDIEHLPRLRFNALYDLANSAPNGVVQVNGGVQNPNTTIYAPTTPGTAGYILQSSGNGAPVWSQTVPVENGGTGATSQKGARTALEVPKVTCSSSSTAPTSPNVGDLWYNTSTGILKICTSTSPEAWGNVYGVWG